MYLTKTPNFIQSLFPNFVWRLPSDTKVLYLTFDDGPVPEATPWILDVLQEYNAKATFFCVGENVTKYPEVFERVIKEGHTIGNHTYNHKSGWDSDNVSYFRNIRKCATEVKSNLFRPPYGRIKPKQAQFLQRFYKIIMWDVLSGDFDDSITADDCLQNILKGTKNGSIIVMHDSVKTIAKNKIILPKLLDHYISLGYEFRNLEHINVAVNQSKTMVV